MQTAVMITVPKNKNGRMVTSVSIGLRHYLRGSLTLRLLHPAATRSAPAGFLFKWRRDARQIGEQCQQNDKSDDKEENENLLRGAHTF